MHVAVAFLVGEFEWHRREKKVIEGGVLEIRLNGLVERVIGLRGQLVRLLRCGRVGDARDCAKVILLDRHAHLPTRERILRHAPSLVG